MWNSVSVGWLAVGGIGLFLAGALTVAAAYLVFRVAAQQERARQQRIDALQLKVDELSAVLMPAGGKHDKAHWDKVAISERVTSIALQAAEDAQVIHARLENALLFSEWVRADGNPNAPWTEIVKWKNKQENKG